MSPSTADVEGGQRAGAAVRDSGVSLAEKVAFLSDPAAYVGVGATVETIETHMSWVFLVGERVFKLKKPVRFAYLDFSTLAAREENCCAELMLNRRLAPDVYLRVAPLTLTSDGALKLDGEGEVLDWLVVMRRLPVDRMLDTLIVNRDLDMTAIDRLAGALARFYELAERPAVPPHEYFRRLKAEEDDNREILTRPRFAIDRGLALSLVERMDGALAAYRSRLEARAAEGFLVDGHGDLKPEHICFQNGVIIFDRLEFSTQLRQVDPVDEIGYLAMECARLGADWLGPPLLQRVLEALGWPDAGFLFQLHSARRALLRARLSLSHLLDPTPRQPERWEPLAAEYLSLAAKALDSLSAL